MALSISSAGLASGIKVYKQSVTNGTATKNLTGTTAMVYLVVLDNTANAAASYLKFYNNVNPTVGTTDPDFIIMAPSTTKLTMHIPSGIAFSTALSIACVTAGGTAGVTNPTSSVLTYIEASE